jgi:hypothetical protein
MTKPNADIHPANILQEIKITINRRDKKNLSGVCILVDILENLLARDGHYALVGAISNLTSRSMEIEK